MFHKLSIWNSHSSTQYLYTIPLGGGLTGCWIRKGTILSRLPLIVALCVTQSSENWKLSQKLRVIGWQQLWSFSYLLLWSGQVQKKSMYHKNASQEVCKIRIKFVYIKNRLSNMATLGNLCKVIGCRRSVPLLPVIP